MSYRRVEALVDLTAVRNNIKTVQSLNDSSMRTLLVIKADAYGHGAVTFAKEFDDLADYYGVACIDEATELRRNGIKKPVLILGYTDEEYFEEAVNEDITLAVYDAEKARLLSDTAEKLGKKARVHIKADSGMSRIGFQCDDEGISDAKKLLSMKGLNVEGVFTHYAKADEEDKTAAKSQYDKFCYFVKGLEEAGADFKFKHIDNSAGAMEIHSKGFDMMRLGIVIYGLYPSEEVSKDVVITPAMTFKSRVVHVKTLPAGRGISYGWTYVTERPTLVATVSAGYADGYPRAQSGIGRVIINGTYAPILGRVCMDQFMIDVTNVPDVKVGDEVTLFGREGNLEIPVEEVAEPAMSFNYEAVCNIARRVPRVYLRDNEYVSTVNYLRQF